MILPEDVISIISTYSKPLKRRRVSEYWNKPNIKSDTDMVSDVVTNIALSLQCHGWFSDCTLRLDIIYHDDVNINVWVIEDEDKYLEMKIKFDFHHVLNWKKNDEKYHIGFATLNDDNYDVCYNVWVSTSWYTPNYITQLINDKGRIVKILS